MRILIIVLLLLLGSATCITSATEVPAWVEWVTIVKERIQSNWTQPAGQPAISTPCRIYLRLTPTGAVESAEIKESCGNAALEASVLAAVRRSSPLPLPRDEAVPHRSLVLNFRAP
jgi:colicin import membrane protein